MAKKGGYVKFKNVCSTLLAILLTSTVYAHTSFGICNYSKENVSYVICYGPAVLNSTTVSNDVKVAGTLDADKTSAGTVTIEGSAYLRDSTIRGPLNIEGKLTAYGVKFQDNIFVSSAKVLLSRSIVSGSIIITSKSANPNLILQCHTTIANSVVFNGSKGLVQISDDSVVQGKIVNATMEFINKKCK
jgi:hypothetical protein